MVNEVISGAALVVVAIIEAYAAVTRRRDRHERERREKREEYRAKESSLAMQMMDANLDLGMATALAVEQGTFNGELRAAKEKATRAQERYRDFLREIAAHQVVKI